MQGWGGGGSWNAGKGRPFLGRVIRTEQRYCMYSMTVFLLCFIYLFTEVQGDDIPLLLSKPMDPSFSFAPTSKQEMISAWTESTRNKYYKTFKFLFEKNYSGTYFTYFLFDQHKPYRNIILLCTVPLSMAQ